MGGDRNSSVHLVEFVLFVGYYDSDNKVSMLMQHSLLEIRIV